MREVIRAAALTALVFCFLQAGVSAQPISRVFPVPGSRPILAPRKPVPMPIPPPVPIDPIRIQPIPVQPIPIQPIPVKPVPIHPVLVLSL